MGIKPYSLNKNLNINTIDISRIPSVNLNTVMNHYIRAGLQYSLIEKTCITQEDDNLIFRFFKFENFNEKIIPFIKFLPKIETTKGIIIEYYASLTFIPNWLKVEDTYILTLGIYAKQLDENDKDIQLFATLDMWIKNLSYVQNNYLAKK